MSVKQDMNGLMINCNVKFCVDLTRRKRMESVSLIVRIMRSLIKESASVSQDTLSF